MVQKSPIYRLDKKATVIDGNPSTPFKSSKGQNPFSIQNKQNILNSIEDKKFFEDLENMQSASKNKYVKKVNLYS